LRKRVCASLAILGLLLCAILLAGCETATESTTHVVPVATPLTVDLRSSNGALTLRGEPGIQSATLVVTRRSRGDSLKKAEERLSRIDIHIATPDGKLEVWYDSREQDADVRRFSGVEFELVVPQESAVNARTSNGDISVESIDGPLDLDTSNGAIDVFDARGSLSADTSNGGIQVMGFEGDVHADTSNGEVRVERVVGSVDAATSNGNITFLGAPPPGSSHNLETSNGSVDVRVPDGSSIHFDAVTSSGTIQSSLPLTGDTEGDDWSADLNPPADIQFNLSTSNGTIRIDRLP
jgi:DUF4097 and DUF4098 domain-containing protein YvlB